jgi:hypothetical protein
VQFFTLALDWTGLEVLYRFIFHALFCGLDRIYFILLKFSRIFAMKLKNCKGTEQRLKNQAQVGTVTSFIM